MLLRSFGRRLKRKAHDPLDADSGEDRHLRRDFPRRVDVAPSSLAGVLALTVLADEQPVDRVVGCVAEIAVRAGERAHGPDVRVHLHGAADGEEQAPEGDVVRDIGVADAAEEDGVVGLESGEGVGGEVGALRFVAGGAPVEVCILELEGVQGGCQGGEDGERRGDDFDADAVARDGGDFVEGFADCRG